MASLNKVQLIGHLGGDPESRITKNDVTIATFSLRQMNSGLTNKLEKKSRKQNGIRSLLLVMSLKYALNSFRREVKHTLKDVSGPDLMKKMMNCDTSQRLW